MFLNEIILKFIEEPVYIHCNFPWRKYSNEQLEKDFNNLKKILTKPYSFPLRKSHAGYKCCDYFFQYERLSVASDTNISGIEYWIRHKNKVLEHYNSNYNQKNLFQIVIYRTRVPAQFSPYVAGMVYKYFNAKKVLDPYAGWGNRCLAAIALNIDYIGIDSNSNLTYCFEQMINFFSYTSNISFINDYSENVETKDVDLVFSSPPFWNNKKLLEKYPMCETNIDIFFDKSLCSLFTKYHKKIPIALYINNILYDKLKEKYGEAQIISFNSSTIKLLNKKSNKNYIIYNIYYWL